MTREQIEKKASELACKCFPDEENIWARDNVEKMRCKTACEIMAEWLLSHQWVSVEDELPPKKERYSKYVIMLSRIGGCYTGRYDFVAKKWLDGRLEDILYVDITHWMPIPPMAEKGDKDE